jgi:SAM-dependent methyltransferase
MTDPAASLIFEADDHENDSAIGEEDDHYSTVSLSSSVLKYREENGRTYHAYKDGQYLAPNDEPERDRLDLQHHLFNLTFSGSLHICPIGEDGTQIHRVLDVGTGTGIWAIDFADEHPETEVLGIDLSAIQPGFVPPNVSFQVDDMEEPWTFRESEKFDFIYVRMMTGSFADWPKFFRQAFE